jgi:hypothetical protein
MVYDVTQLSSITVYASQIEPFTVYITYLNPVLWATDATTGSGQFAVLAVSNTVIPITTLNPTSQLPFTTGLISNSPL